MFDKCQLYTCLAVSYATIGDDRSNYSRHWSIYMSVRLLGNRRCLDLGKLPYNKHTLKGYQRRVG